MERWGVFILLGGVVILGRYVGQAEKESQSVGYARESIINVGGTELFGEGY